MIESVVEDEVVIPKMTTTNNRKAKAGASSAADLVLETKKASLLAEKRALRNNMLLGWGSSILVGIATGAHLTLDQVMGWDTYGDCKVVYLVVFLCCFAFASYVDNKEALKERPSPQGGTPELEFLRNAHFQHYSWFFSIVTAVAYPLACLAGVVEDPDVWGALVWIAPSLIIRLAVGMSAILHRFVAHRAFEPRNRVVQFVLCCMGCLAAQGSPIFWGSMHNRHHKNCDTKLDPHSPQVYPFWYAFIGWTVYEANRSEEKYLMKLWRYPELHVLHKFFYVPACMEFAFLTYMFGFSTMLYGAWLPGTLCALFTLLFNVRSHHPAKEELPEGTCKAINAVDIGAWIVGESAHEDHHSNPAAFNRNTDMWFGWFDFPYFVFINPLQLLGLVELPANVSNSQHDFSKLGEAMVSAVTVTLVSLLFFICGTVATKTTA